MPKNLSVEGRWWQKVKIGAIDACWPWTASRDADGYGRFQEPTERGQRHVRAHRWAYEHFRGDIPAGLVVMHSCDNPPCVNPAHLILGTPLQNNDDKVSKGRNPRRWGSAISRAKQTHCKNDHPLSGSNLYITPKGYRRCKTCSAANARRTYRAARGLPGDGQPRSPRG